MQKFSDALNYLIAFLIIISLNFFLPRLMPGDPLMAIYGGEALIQMTDELKAQLVEKFALDKSLWEQFTSYITALVQGDMGYSYYFNSPVSKVILKALPWTLLLVGTATIISTTVGIILGMESGWRRGRKLDKFLLAGIMFLNGFPDFFIGMVLLLIFGVVFNILPLSGGMTPYVGYTGFLLVIDVLKHLILPAVSLAVVNLTSSYLLTRNSMVATLGENFITTAKAKGLRDWVVRYRHAGRNSLLPVITNIGIQMGRLMTGALFVEIVFSYPGLGSMIHSALQTRDYPLLQGIFLVVTVFVLSANFMVDMIYKKIDPRLRTCTSTTGKELNPTA